MELECRGKIREITRNTESERRTFWEQGLTPGKAKTLGAQHE